MHSKFININNKPKTLDRSMPNIVKNKFRHNSFNLTKYSLTIFILLVVFGSKHVHSLNEDCEEECQPNEYCSNGMCVDSSLLNLVLRSEEISEHNSPINTPIRIHKYNLEQDSDEESSEDDSQQEDNSQLENNLVDSINSLWSSEESDTSNLRNSKRNDEESSNESSAEEDTSSEEENDDEEEEDSNYDQDSIIKKINKRNNSNRIDELLSELNEDDSDSEEDLNQDSAEDSDEEDSAEENANEIDSEEDNDDSTRLSKRSTAPKSNKKILNDLLNILSQSNDRNKKYDTDDDDDEDDEGNDEEYEQDFGENIIMDLKLNDDGSFNIEEIKALPANEKGILEPLVYDRETQDKNDDRYFEEDSISEISPAKLEALNELAEDLPSDNAYFAPQREQETLDKDYFEAPKRSYKSQRHLESREQQDEDSSENFETVQLSSIENNPLESFLESMVNPDSESEDSEENKYENRVVKRVYVLPDETTESSEEPRPRMGLIDLLTNRENRFDSSEYSNVPEYDSNEQEQILMLTPARTNIWDLEEQDLPRRELYETPSIGLIDLLTQSKRYGYDYNPEFETRRQQRTFILSPKRSHMWIDEEKIASPYDDSDSPSLLEKLVNNDDLVPITSNENPQIEKIKSDLQQEEEKFIDTLHENQSTDKKFQMVDNSAELSSKDSVSLQQVSDMNDQKNFIQIKLNKNIERHEAEDLLSFISQLTAVDSSLIKDLSVKENSIWFRLDGLDNRKDLELFIQETLNHEQQIKQEKGLTIVEFNLVNNPEIVEKRKLANSEQTAKKYFLITIATCGSVFAILITLLSIFVIRRRAYLRNKLINELNLPKKKNFDDVERLVEGDYEQSNKFTKFLSKLCSSKQKCDTLESNDSTPNKDTEKILSRQSHQDYQLKKDLCRSEEFVPTHLMTTPVTTNTEMTRKSNVADGSNRSSTSSCTPANSTSTTQIIALPVLSEEPINNIDIDVTTGHVILAYMENHLNDKNRILKEWEDLSAYEAEPNKTEIGNKFMTKNRYSNILPYDHNRVKLHEIKSEEDDYINASYITDDDPKNPAYIATQGPLNHTTSDFWQMVWEQNSVMIISLCRTVEYGSSKCNQYWPTNGIQTYGIFEVNLVSEHVWCEDYLVRSFYLKNLSNGLSRTVTQFHFLTWPENDLPQNFKTILDFRRKVNRSYKKKSTPIIVHCNDGVGRTGTFVLIDMILNKIVKGAKEIDLAATIEFLRDQRIEMVKSKNQFEFAFAVIADEVQNMLKSQDE